MLEEAGLVRTEKNRGVFVRDIPIDEAIEIFDLRAAMDELVGRRLAERITPPQLKEVRALVDAMERAVKADDARGYHLLNLQFHDRLVEMAGNRKLTSIYRKLIKELSLFRRLNLEAEGGGLMPISAGEHRAIVKAIASGDPDAAGQAMHEHVIESKERTRDHTTCGASDARTSAMEPDSCSTSTAELPAAEAPTVVVCVDGCEPDYLAQAVAGGAHALAEAHARRRHGAGRRLRGAELHQPEQPVDRDRRAALGARHLRQLPLRHRHGHRGDDERPEVAARADAAGGAGRRRGKAAP